MAALSINYLPHQPLRPMGLTDDEKKKLTWAFGVLGAVIVGGFVWAQIAHRKAPMAANRKKRGHKKMFGRNGACRSQGGPYLFPQDKAYPVPTLGCAKLALTYAAWPNNIESAPSVIRAMRRSRWGRNPKIVAQMRRLAKRYAAEKHTRAPKV